MDNAVPNAFIPLLTAIVAPVVQVLVKRVLRIQLEGSRILIITATVAIIATAFAFMIVSNATHCAVTNLGWVPFSNDGLGSTITVNPVAGSNCAIEVSFDLKKQGGYVATYKKLEPKLLEWWISGIEFSYSGMGNPNTIEFKLFDKADSQYKVVLGHMTDTGGKVLSWSIPYRSLTAPDSGKLFEREGFALDRMDFTFSSWPQDAAGTGNVVIHDIRVILSWQIWLIMFSPMFVIGIIMAYSAWQKRIGN